MEEKRATFAPLLGSLECKHLETNKIITIIIILIKKHWKFLVNFPKGALKFRVFWVNIAKSEVNLRYRYCSKLFGILRKKIEFRYYRCQNITKSMREKKKKVERENVEFRQR